MKTSKVYAKSDLAKFNSFRVISGMLDKNEKSFSFCLAEIVISVNYKAGLRNKHNVANVVITFTLPNATTLTFSGRYDVVLDRPIFYSLLVDFPFKSSVLYSINNNKIESLWQDVVEGVVVDAEGVAPATPIQEEESEPKSNVLSVVK